MEELVILQVRICSIVEIYLSSYVFKYIPNLFLKENCPLLPSLPLQWNTMTPVQGVRLHFAVLQMTSMNENMIRETKVRWTHHQCWMMILRRPTPDSFALTDIEASTSPSLLVSPVPAPRSRTSSIQTFILPSLLSSTCYPISTSWSPTRAPRPRANASSSRRHFTEPQRLTSRQELLFQLRFHSSVLPHLDWDLSHSVCEFLLLQLQWKWTKY